MLDIENTVFSLVFENDKLTCESPIEVPYCFFLFVFCLFVCFFFFDFFFCGSEVDLVIRLLPVLQCMPRKGIQAKEENHQSFRIQTG